MKYLFALLGLLCSASVFAADNSTVQPIEHFSGWRVYTAKEEGHKICFMAASPLSSSPKREDAYLMVARRPYAKEMNVITVMTGVDYHEKHIPTFGIDNQKVVSMVTQKDAAFIENANQEKDLIEKMIDGNVVRIVSKSKRGTILKDTYSLKGFTKALNSITSECPDEGK